MMRTITTELLAKALIDPASVFQCPMDIVNNKHIDDEQKIDLLRHWEYDAKELLVAEEEGFPVHEHSTLLGSIVIALHKLGAAPDIKHSPPTKQGGV